MDRQDNEERDEDFINHVQEGAEKVKKLLLNEIIWHYTRPYWVEMHKDSRN